MKHYRITFSGLSSMLQPLEVIKKNTNCIISQMHLAVIKPKIVTEIWWIKTEWKNSTQVKLFKVTFLPLLKTELFIKQRRAAVSHCFIPVSAAVKRWIKSGEYFCPTSWVEGWDIWPVVNTVTPWGKKINCLINLEAITAGGINLM